MTITQVNQWLTSKKIKVQASKIKRIKNSFTNAVYRIKGTDHKYYKLRLANENQYINRKLEYFIETNLYPKDFLYYSKKSGNYFRLWYKGHHPKKKHWNQALFDAMMKIIKQYQSLKVPTVVNATYPKYFEEHVDITDNLKKEFELYKNIIKSFKQSDLVLSHNDFSSNNMIIDEQQQLKVYDFEWSTYNHKLWDICNMIKDLELNIEEVCTISQIQANISQYIKMIFAVHFYTIIWTYRVEPTTKVLKYRKHILKRLSYWYKQVELLNHH